MQTMRNIKLEKNILREKYKNIRKAMSPEFKNECDIKIFERVTSLYQYKNCRYLFTYVSKELEADTRRLIEKALADGKIVAVPKCIENHQMDFYAIRSLDDLETGRFGLLEPKTDICPKIRTYYRAICIVPGMAFDFRGCRIGYGGGYYDRFLADFSGIKTGICYSSCIQWKLPKGLYDTAVDLLVTEKYFRKCALPHG